MDIKTVNPFLYTLEANKIDLSKLSTEALFGRQRESEHPITDYILPKEFAARFQLHIKAGTRKLTLRHRDVPLTNRNLIESHLYTRCQLLDNPELIYPRLCAIYKQIKNWDERSDRVTSYDHFSQHLHPDILDIAGDRIRYIPPYDETRTRAERHSTPIVMQTLESIGVKYSELVKPLIAYIEQTDNFIHEGKIVSFLKNVTTVAMPYRALEIALKDQGRYRIGGASLNVKAVGAETIANFLIALYLQDFKQWYRNGSWVEHKGQRIYVNHHSVVESRALHDYIRTNYRYPNQLPFGIHPSAYFAQRIEELAKMSYDNSHLVKYPDDFKAYIDLSHTKHRQIVTGLDLVNEGVLMRHCVGGENYQEEMSSGNMLFFHIDIPGDEYGATLSLERDTRLTGRYQLGDSYWDIDQFYGHGNSEIEAVYGPEILSNFLKEFFIEISRKTIRQVLPLNEQRAIHVPFKEPYKGCPIDLGAAFGRTFYNIWGGLGRMHQPTTRTQDYMYGYNSRMLMAAGGLDSVETLQLAKASIFDVEAFFEVVGTQQELVPHGAVLEPGQTVRLKVKEGKHFAFRLSIWNTPELVGVVSEIVRIVIRDGETYTNTSTTQQRIEASPIVSTRVNQLTHFLRNPPKIEDLHGYQQNVVELARTQWQEFR